MNWIRTTNKKKLYTHTHLLCQSQCQLFSALKSFPLLKLSLASHLHSYCSSEFWQKPNEPKILLSSCSQGISRLTDPGATECTLYKSGENGGCLLFKVGDNLLKCTTVIHVDDIFLALNLFPWIKNPLRDHPKYK